MAGMAMAMDLISSCTTILYLYGASARGCDGFNGDGDGKGAARPMRAAARAAARRGGVRAGGRVGRRYGRLAARGTLRSRPAGRGLG